MNLFNNLFFIIFMILFSGCSNHEEKKISILSEDQIEFQMIEAYNAGVKAFDNEDFLKAANKFNEAELLFPQSDWAPKASLMAAYSYYYDNYNNDAIYQLELFIKTYPNDKKVSYANYLLAMSHYNKIVDEKKDLGPLIQSKEKFEFVIKNYPNTDFALDSNFKLDLIQETLASKEMYIAKHYIKKGKWIAAINRLKSIVENYETTIFIEEALHRLVEIYYKIGLIEESKKYANLLGYNYASSDWYKNSYKLFNKKYENPYKKIKKSKKNSALKKIKSILD
jgi:outer membrane protein assembly factor BamD